MITLRETVEIDRPLEEVFNYVVNVENAPKWQPAVIEVKRITNGPIGVGTKFKEVAKMMGRRVDTICEITELETNKKFAFKGTSSGPFEYESTYTLEPKENGTSISIVGNFRTKGFWRLLEPFIKGEVAKESSQELAAMKEAIESRRV